MPKRLIAIGCRIKTGRVVLSFETLTDLERYSETFCIFGYKHFCIVGQLHGELA
ncbi:hypothetical protein [Coleofasciculus chthonoplastes]|uniref:hypothetical protein n=1 Tax=Coleofasciculus sp. A1-SPW-01 TaxID=3070819 RepID=UPI0002EF36AB